VLVTQTDPADVARRAVRRGGRVEVEPSEHQTLVRRVERRDPLGGLEDHRVALDEATLVTEAAAPMALVCERLGVLGGLVELPVDAVHEVLLVGDLLLGHRVGGRRSPRGDVVDGQATAPGCGQNLGQAVRASGQLYPAAMGPCPRFPRSSLTSPNPPLASSDTSGSTPSTTA
jgi:hypothetical protein